MCDSTVIQSDQFNNKNNQGIKQVVLQLEHKEKRNRAKPVYNGYRGDTSMIPV
jgi:hypothetical protein